jgi:hypothetical protein
VDKGTIAAESCCRVLCLGYDYLMVNFIDISKAVLYHSSKGNNRDARYYLIGLMV